MVGVHMSTYIIYPCSMIPATFVKISFGSYLAEGNANTHEVDTAGPKMTLVCLLIFVLHIMEPPPRHPKSDIIGDCTKAVTIISIVIDINTMTYELLITIIIMIIIAIIIMIIIIATGTHWFIS